MTDFKLVMSGYPLDDYPLADVHEDKVKMKRTKRKKKGITRMILTLRS